MLKQFKTKIEYVLCILDILRTEYSICTQFFQFATYSASLFFIHGDQCKTLQTFQHFVDCCAFGA